MSLSVLSGCGSGSSDSSSSDTSSADTTATDQTQDETEATGDVETYDTVNIGSTASRTVGHFDPTGLLSDNYSMPSIYLVFDRLMYIQDDEYVSDILEDFYWDDSLGDYGGTVFQFKDDVYFANGDQLTVDDFIYSLDRASQVPRTAANYAMLLMDQAEISDDNLTISIPWSKTYGAWPLIVSSLVMLDASWIEENGGEENFDWFDPSLVCGSGPYAVTEFTNGISTTFELRDDWWYKDEADADYCSIQTINIKQYSDSNTLMVDYETGTIDAAVNLSASDVDSINDAAGSKGTAVTIPSNYTAAIVLGVDNNSIFDNMNLRKAICLGTDADAIATAVYGSLGDPATSTLPTSSPYYKAGYAYTYDLEAAQAALADYYAETGESSVNLTFVAASGGVDAEIAELFQAYMEAVGITVDLQILDQGTAVGMWIDGATDFMINNSANGNSTNEVTNVYEHYESTDVFKADARQGEEINSLLTAGRLTVDTTERASIYEQVQQYFYDNYEVIPVAEWNVAYAYNDTISEMSLLDVTRPNLRFMAG
jgi:ABC-type transport system substrate-binding protein